MQLSNNAASRGVKEFIQEMRGNCFSFSFCLLRAKGGKLHTELHTSFLTHKGIFLSKLKDLESTFCICNACFSFSCFFPKIRMKYFAGFCEFTYRCQS
jgi:hypothetical protein